ncbi:MAG: sensor domain-containing diguanylate cyclase [Clostridiales bacterium]|jgi:diguanylate cyclase (GGDEF)-like protein/PAS domain S-box-containing protein|nr:sensor domain-containing diguanylate cyclase [Clostridiales bacterium]
MLNEQIDQLILDSLEDGVYCVDTGITILRWNSTAERITGYKRSDMIGRKCFGGLMCHLDSNEVPLCSAGCPLVATVHDGELRAAAAFVRSADGDRIPVQVKVAPVYGENKEIVAGIATLSKQAKDSDMVDMLAKTAMTDKLTKLYNRGYFEGELNVLLERMRDSKDLKLALFFFDIDNFSKFNNTYGHDVGDKVLSEVSGALQRSLRKPDIVCRWGGEEFVGLCQIRQESSLPMIGQKVQKIIENTIIDVDRNVLSVTASVGVTLVTKEDTVETAVQRADGLMYQSKKNGKNRYTAG